MLLSVLAHFPTKDLIAEPFMESDRCRVELEHVQLDGGRTFGDRPGLRRAALA